MATIKIKRGTGVPASLAEGEMAVDVSGSAVYVNAKATSGAADNIVRVGNEIVDDDTFATASATTVPSSESVKAYVDTEVLSAGVAGITSTATSTQIELSDSITKFTNDIELHHPNGNKIEFFTASAPASSPKGEIQMYSDTQMFFRAGLANAAQIVLDSTGGGSTTFQSAVTFDTDVTVNGLTVGRGLGNDSSSVALGDNALASSTTGGNNTAIGESALENLTTGLSNTAIGAYSGLALTGGSFNVSVGHAAYSYGTGNYNTAIGYNSMSGSVTGGGNAGCGYNTLNDLTSGAGNSAFGTEALPKVTTGNYNAALGANAGNDLTTGSSNILIGYFAGQNLTTSVQNVAIGTQALNTSINAYGENTCVGYKSLYAVTNGQGNTAMGWSALDDLTTGVANTGIGFNCGIGLTTGGNNTVIGFEATPSSASVNNQITLGDANISSLRCNVTHITSLSDMRDKTNIADLSGASNFIKNLEPVSFDWARRDNTMQGVQSHGFLAQQLQSAQDSTGYKVPGLVFDDNPDKLEAAYGNLLPTMVAALKDALTEIDELKAKVAALESA